MKWYVLTDLEGIVGVEQFEDIRQSNPEGRATAMQELTREVNACIEGIKEADSDAEVLVWDGHGPGGLLPDQLVGGKYIREGRPNHHTQGCSGVLFVGQHAMAGTYQAPLCHTFNSRTIVSYQLNGVFVGEFTCYALGAGVPGAPTIMLSGDDKAASEAKVFVPEIETATVKWGRNGVIRHLTAEQACDAIREAAARAVRRRDEIQPIAGFTAPYELVIHYRNTPKHPPGNAVFPYEHMAVVRCEELTELPFCI